MNGTDTFLDINNANLRVNSGNVQASAFILDQIDFIASSNASTTVGFNNATTAFLAVSNIEVGTANLFVDTTTSNVGIGTNAPLDTLHVKGGTLIDGDLTVNGTISAPSSSLQAVTDTGNVTSNTVQFSNAITSLTATSNIEVAGFVGSSGTGALTVPSGTTEDRPTPYVAGMIRYNSTTGFMEAYSGGVWAPIAQPPTVTGVSPLTTLVSGGIPFGWNTGTKIVASDAASGTDLFGYSVDTNSTGTRVVVGAYSKDAPSNSVGVAYVFTYDGSNWDTGARIGNGVGANDYFGWSVAMNSDGTKVIVGSPYEDPDGTSDAGSAYIFTYDGSNWDTGTKIVAFDKAANDAFGHAVSMSGDGTKVIVGARSAGTGGAAYIFTYDGSNWNTGTKKIVALAAVANSGDRFGTSVSINSNGTKVIVGAEYHTTSAGWGAGGAYIFTYDGSNWDTGTEILASGGVAQDYFGNSVAMNSDGTKVIVGAHRVDGVRGAAYIFTYGLIHYNQWDTGTKIVAFDPQANDEFGYSVAMNSDGTKVIVGAYQEDPPGTDGAGAAYIFTYDGSNWDTGTKIVAFDAQNYDYFGRAVSISGNGAKVIVGADSEDRPSLGDAGAAYIFDYQATELFDASTQVFTAAGTGIVSGSTVQLEGVDGTLYSVSNVTPNTAGTQVTFKMGSEGVEFPPSAMTDNQALTTTPSGMTSGYEASSSDYSNQGDAWKAFDNVVTTSSYWNASNDTYSTTAPYLAKESISSTSTQDISGSLHVGHWVQLQIPNPVILSRAVIGSTTQSNKHGQFVILGSNNPLGDPTHGSGWTLLHAGLGTTISTNVTTLSAGSTEAFKYFRVVIKSKTATTTDGHIQLNNIQFFGRSGSWDLAQQPYKVRINSTSGLIGTSTAKIGFPPTWTTAAGANLSFDIAQSTTQTLLGTDGGGGINRTFSISPLSAVQALPAKVGGGNLELTTTPAGGVITGQIAANQDGITTPVTFRLTDNASGLFTDREIDIVGMSELYPFTSHTFTPAGKSGQSGPSLVDLRAAYTPSWTDNPNYLNLTTIGVQSWTVPSTGNYTIKLAGASGGYVTSSSANIGGFRGIEMSGTYSLTKSEVINIIVGQHGEYQNSGGGGGGSFVYRNATDTYPICVAGGGGSINNWANTSLGSPANQYTPGAWSDGQSGTSGGGAQGGSGYSSSAGGTGGNGGAAASSASSNYGSGGAGWLTDGADSNNEPNGGGHAPRSSSQPGYGGDSNGGYAHGGFGGGGGTHGNTGGAGGGGGYSGGGGGGYATPGGAGGGGSYGGSATGIYVGMGSTPIQAGNGLDSTQSAGDGYVIITKQ